MTGIRINRLAITNEPADSWDNQVKVYIDPFIAISPWYLALLLEGFKKLAAFVYSGYFSLDTAILRAAKAAYLVALLLATRGHGTICAEAGSLILEYFESRLQQIEHSQKDQPGSIFSICEGLNRWSCSGSENCLLRMSLNPDNCTNITMLHNIVLSLNICLI
jgi:hypothetical protein